MNFDLLFAKAKEKGVEAVQVYYTEDKELRIDTMNQVVDKYTIAETKVLSVKGIYNGKMGSVYSEILTDESIDEVLESLIENAKAIDNEDEVFIYAGDEKYESVEGIYNEELGKIDAKEKIALVAKIDETSQSAPNMALARASYVENEHKVLIKNSKGLNLENTSNFAGAYASVIVRNDKDQRTAFELGMDNNFYNIKPEEISKRASDYANRLLGAKPVKSGEYEVVLKNGAMSSLLATFAQSLSADQVQKGLSVLNRNRFGEKLASDLVTIVDDPFKKNSIRSTSFDDEGVATSYKELIKDGVFQGILYDLRTAKKDGVKSTGNGFNGSVAPTNLYMVPSDKSYEDMISDIKHGVVITELQGTHAGTNAISGDFSLQMVGFVIEDGKETAPIALSTASGNVFTVLKEITDIASDLKVGFGSISAPSVRVKSLVISGE